MAATRLRQPASAGRPVALPAGRLLSTGGSMVIRLCEGRFGITRREWRVIARLAGSRTCCRPNWPSASSSIARAPRAPSPRWSPRSWCAAQPGAADRRQARLALTPEGQRVARGAVPAGVRRSTVACCRRWRPTEVQRARGRTGRDCSSRPTCMVQAAELPKADRRRGGRVAPGDGMSRRRVAGAGWLAARLAAVRVPARGVAGGRARGAAACCTPPPARARPTPCGWACWTRCCARHPPGRGGRAAARDLAHADARAGLGHHRALAEPLRDLAPHWTIGQRTGDTRQRRARAAGPPLADRAGHDARVADLMLTRENAREELAGVDYVVVDEWHELIGSKRGVQAQLALARLRRFNPGAGHLGAERDAGQPRGGDGGPVRRRMPRARAAAGARQDRQDAGDRHADPARSRQVLLGRPPGRAHAAAGGGGDRAGPARRWSSPTCARRPRSGTSCCWRRGRSGPAQIALHHGSLDRATREWVEHGLKEGTPARGGRHVVARPRRRLPAGRARAADRLGQGRRAHDAARRPQRPRTGPGQPRHAGAHEHHGDHRGGGGALRRAGRPRRAARRRPTSRWTCWCSTSSPSRWAAASRADALFDEVRARLVVPRAHARRVRLGAGLLRTRRREPGGLSRLPPHRARTRTGV